jgi:ATP-dependent DNA helicase RecQ
LFSPTNKIRLTSLAREVLFEGQSTTDYSSKVPTPKTELKETKSKSAANSL